MLQNFQVPQETVQPIRFVHAASWRVRGDARMTSAKFVRFSSFLSIRPLCAADGIGRSMMSSYSLSLSLFSFCGQKESGRHTRDWHKFGLSRRKGPSLKFRAVAWPSSPPMIGRDRTFRSSGLSEHAFAARSLPLGGLPRIRVERMPDI